ncbi:MAG: aminomethyl-transferring glycine dehydrogenase subunit GcvPB, partial [Myxococcota bacterium]
MSIGRVRAFFGNFGIMVRAFAYLCEMGAEGLKMATQIAVLNANYILSQLRSDYHLPYGSRCMHECVFTDRRQLEFGVSTLDIAKRLMDHGFHP